MFFFSGEKITKVIFCRLHEWLVALRDKRYITYGIRARVETLGPFGLKMLPHVFILN